MAKKKFSDSTRKKTIKSLEAAAKVLKNHEWIQCEEVLTDFDEKTGKEVPYAFCALGALNHVKAPESAQTALTRTLDALFVKRSKLLIDAVYMAREDALDNGEDMPTSFAGTIVDFNDDYAKSRRDVLAVFRATVKALKNKEI